MENNSLRRFYELKIEEYTGQIKLYEELCRKAIQYADFDLARSYLKDLDFAIESKEEYKEKLENEF